ncbi:MAG: hypothetical protein JSS96_02935 [Bacteroidetes bacterium]|nr:hypothetical protein [Bacteroidota bacterium]
MKKGLFKKILLTTGSVFVLLAGILCIHIYMVTRPKAPYAHTRAMARIDFKQDISTDDANKITAWMYQQKGVDHVLYNPASKILVFTFAPLSTTADQIVNNMRSSLNYNAVRFVPTEKDLKSGCPVAATSFTYKAYSFFKHIF